MSRLKEMYEVDFDVLDFTGKLSINGLCGYMQAIAARHATKLGINFFKNGEELKYYWILSRVRYEILEYPRWEDTVSLETYPGGYDKLYAVRLFDLRNTKGELVAHITGDYLLMDKEKGRPVKIKGIEGPMTVLDFPYEGEKIEKLQGPTNNMREEKRKAYYSEMDLNGHMNNAHYIRWSMDMLPLEILEKQEVASLKINYNSSITYGKEVKMVLGQQEDKYIIAGTNPEETVNYFITEIELRDRK